MLLVIFFILLFFFINQGLFSFYEKRHPFLDRKKLNLLYLYHTFFYGFYYWYVQFNPSDSKVYFAEISTHPGTWFELFGTDTNFIYFFGYPFYHIGFSTYETLMFLFSWFGFLGFLYAYLFFRENIPIKVKVFKYIDLLTFLLFLPNMHFWTVSLAKGSTIFMGLMMFTYAISRPRKRIFLLVLGSLIIFHIRPHVFLFVAVGTVIGYFSGKEKVSFSKKLLISSVMLGSLIIAQDQILAVAGLGGSEDVLEDFENFAEKRAGGLADAGSGVEMASYPLPLKLFTFWFRPLFFDVRGIMGLIISFENLLYLILFLNIIKKNFIRFLMKAPSLVKMSLIIFLTSSLAMSFVMSNLGLIMRQKSMVMYFLFFVIYYYLAQKKYSRIIKIRKLKLARQQRLKKKGHVST